MHPVTRKRWTLALNANEEEEITMPKKTKFVDLAGDVANRTYRITFECCAEDYNMLMNEIGDYGNVIKEEVEVTE
jgi:hypothetical protein